MPRFSSQVQFYWIPLLCSKYIVQDCSITLELQVSVTKFFRRFKNNHLWTNQEKSHILLRNNKPEIVSIEGIPLGARSHEKLLDVTINSDLNLENHIAELCLKLNEKS